MQELKPLYCPCLIALAIAALLILLWALCVVARRADNNADKSRRER